MVYKRQAEQQVRPDACLQVCSFTVAPASVRGWVCDILYQRQNICHAGFPGLTVETFHGKMVQVHGQYTTGMLSSYLRKLPRIATDIPEGICFPVSVGVR